MTPAEATAILDRTLPLPAMEIDAPVKPVETPTETPTRIDNPDGGDGSEDGETDLDEEIKRIVREIPDPTPQQPGGE